MKKAVYGKKLSRGRGSRKALYRSLIRALVTHGSINTTKAKARTIQRDIDKLVNLAKKDGQLPQRKIYAWLGNDRQTTQGLVKKVAPNFKDIVGGFTRIINLPNRKGDMAKMARIEWTREVGISEKGTRNKTNKKVKNDNKITAKKQPKRNLRSRLKLSRKNKK